MILRVPTERVHAITGMLVASGVAEEAILTHALGRGQLDFESNIAGILSRQAGRQSSYVWGVLPHESRPTTLVTHIPSGQTVEAVTKQNMQAVARDMFDGKTHVGSHLHSQLFSGYQQRAQVLCQAGYAIEYVPKRTTQRALIAVRAPKLLERCGVRNDKPYIQLSDRALALFQHLCSLVENE